MNRKEFDNLILEWNSYLLLEEIYSNLEDKVLEEGFKDLLKKYGQDIAIIMSLMTTANITNFGINRINNSNQEAVQNILANSVEGNDNAIRFIYNTNVKDLNQAYKNLSQDDIENVDFVSLFTRVFKDSFIDSLKKSSIKSFSGIYSKEVFEAWHTSILQNDSFLKEVYDFITDEDHTPRYFVYKGMKLFIHPMNSSDTEKYASNFTNNLFESIKIKKIKNNDEIIILSNDNNNDLNNIKEELVSFGIDLDIYSFKRKLKENFKNFIESYCINRQTDGRRTLGYYYDINVLTNLFEENAKALIDSEYQQLKGKVSIELNINKGGIIGIDANRSRFDIYTTISHELGHALSQGYNGVDYFYHDFIRFLKVNDFENLSLRNFKIYIKNKMFKGVNWTEIKSEKQKEFIDICLMLLNRLESSNFIELERNSSGEIKEIIINADVKDKWSLYYHEPEERVELFKDWCLEVEDLNFEKDASIKILKEIKDILIIFKTSGAEYYNKRLVKQFPDINDQLSLVFHQSLYHAKFINKRDRNRKKYKRLSDELGNFIINRNTTSATDCLDGINNLIELYESHNQHDGHNH
tara:strand:- start:1204 stop:2946 length:1743 start_codon:yes stop_codon:yes gene_type:complete